MAPPCTPRSTRILAGLVLVAPLFVAGCTALPSGPSAVTANRAVPPSSTLTSPLAADLGAPAVAVSATGKIDLWSRTTDGLAAHRGRTTWGWTANQSLGAPALLYSAPFTASSSPGSNAVFVQGPYGEVYQKTSPQPGSYSGWAWLAGQIAGRPAAASPAAGQFDVFGGSRTGALMTRSADTSGSRYGWTSLGGKLATGSGPGAASTQGRTSVVIRGTDDKVWLRTRDTAGRYSAWANLGGGTKSDPAVASSAGGRLDIFIRGLDNALWHRTAGSATSGWQRLGGALTSGPSAAAPPGGGTVTVVGRGSDGSRYYSGTLSATGAWSAWSIVSHTGPAATAPSWNPHVTCKAVVTTLETVLGNQVSPLGGATFDSGRFNPSIPDADRTADSPACSVDGQGMLVEVHRVMMANGCSAADDGDWSCNLYDPAATTVPYNLRVLHTEAVGAWASHPGWNPTHAPSGQLIDVQGFVWWDPTHTDADWHTYSGWEFHPFTAWRPAQ